MKSKTPRRTAPRTAAARDAATRHLKPGQKLALKVLADAEHTDGPEREALTRKAKELAESPSGKP